MGVERDIAKKRQENESLAGRGQRHPVVPHGIDPDPAEPDLDDPDESGETDDDEDERPKNKKDHL